MLEEIDMDNYEDDIAINMDMELMDDDEEEMDEAEYRATMNGHNGSNLDIIQENPDDEVDASGSKHESPPQDINQVKYSQEKRQNFKETIYSQETNLQKPQTQTQFSWNSQSNQDYAKRAPQFIVMDQQFFEKELNKETAAAKFVNQMRKTADENRVKKYKQTIGKNVDQSPTNLMNKKIELSQYSDWSKSEKSANFKNKLYKRGKSQSDLHQNNTNGFIQALNVIEDKKMNSMMDREGLIQELQEYKKFALQQYDYIKFLKVEINKVKKLAAQQVLKFKQDQAQNVLLPYLAERDSTWLKEQDAIMLRPKDQIRLQEEIVEIRKQLNKAEEEVQKYKVEAEKYKKRAKYTVDKFQQIKQKEMQFIQYGDEKAKVVVHLMEAKFKKKIEELSSKLKKQEEESNELKMKVLEKQNQNKFRIEYEKSQKIVKKFEDKCRRLETLNKQQEKQIQLQKEIAQSMISEDTKQQQKEELNLIFEKIEAISKFKENEKDELLIQNKQQLEDELQMMMKAKLVDPENPQKVDLDDYVSPFKFSQKSGTKEDSPRLKKQKGQIQEKESPKRPETAKEYVTATLTAWNQCPTIVKKQLDQQMHEIKGLKEQLRSATLKLNQKKADFDKQASLENKIELQKHKDFIEQAFRAKLEEEKMKMNKQKVEEINDIFQENINLRKQISNLNPQKAQFK